MLCINVMTRLLIGLVISLVLSNEELEVISP